MAPPHGSVMRWFASLRRLNLSAFEALPIFAPGPYKGPQRSHPELVDANQHAEDIADQVLDNREILSSASLQADFEAR